jgi:hypothetical protein
VPREEVLDIEAADRRAVVFAVSSVHGSVETRGKPQHPERAIDATTS